MKEKLLDKATIDAYQAWVQYGIRRDLNSISLGPGKLPFRCGIALLVLAFFCLVTGILLLALRMKHVYLWDWGAQFLGPFFFILCLMCLAGASYMFLLAKRRSNKYRRELYFRPIGDWGVSCIHNAELAREEELKQQLKSGTTPHKTVKPRSEAYSQSSRGGRRNRPPQGHDGRDNRAYDKSPLDANKPFRPDDRRRPPPGTQGGPGPDGRRGPPPGERRGPPPDGRRGPPPDGKRGPPPDGRRGPAPDGRRGPAPDPRRGPPPPEDRVRVQGPPPEYEERGPNGRGPHTDDPRRPPPNVHRTPRGTDVESDDQDSRPRGMPRFDGVRRLPDEERREYRNISDHSRDESDI